MVKRILIFAAVALFLAGCSTGIEEKAVAETKLQMTGLAEKELPVMKDFMPEMNFVPRSDIKTHIVLHFISNAAVNPENPYEYEEIRKTLIEYDVSPHYMINREGQIYFLMPESRAARHAGKGDLAGYPQYTDELNDYSIGIELMAIGTEAEMKGMILTDDYKKIPQEHIGFTSAQYESLNLLIEDIIARNKQIKRDREHIIGHDDYAFGRKTDPGSLFQWKKIIQNQ